MTTCLWNRIDAYLVAQLTANMGAASSYTTLKLAKVEAGETFDIDHVTMPYCLVRGVDVRYDNEGPHGDGDIHFDDIRYPYDIILVAEATTTALAKSYAKELLSRVREWVRSDFYLAGLVDDDGEIVRRSELGELRIGVVGTGGQNRGKYLGWASMQLTIVSEV